MIVRRTVAALLACSIVVAGLVFASPAATAAPVTVTDPNSGASITLSTNRIAPGERVEISGRGFVPVQGSTGEPLVAVRPYDFDAGPAWTTGGRDAHRPADPSQPPGSEAKYWFVTHHDDGGSFEGWLEAPAGLTEAGPLGNGQHWLRILSGAFFTTTGDRLTDPITFQVPFTVAAGPTASTGLTSPTGVFQAGTIFRPGAQVTLRGDGFTPDAALAVTLDGADLDAAIAVGSDGSLPGSARITLPSGTSIGTHTLRLATGSIAATVALRVTAAPTATILTPSVRPGEAVAYDLTGYIGVGGAPQKVAVVVNEKVLTCVQAGGDGAASGLTALPADLTGTVVVGFNVGLSCVLPPAGVINDQPISRLAPSVTVSDSAPVLSAVAISGKLAVTGAGFTAGKSVRVRVGNTDAGTLTADAEGRISGQLTAPTASAGQRVLADDGTRTAAASVRVEEPRTATLALSAPTPLGYGAARKTTVTLQVAGKAATGAVVVSQGSWTSTVQVSAAGTAVALPRTAAVGKHTVTARFAGDATTRAATASRTFTVTKAKSSASLKLSASKVKRTKRATATVKITVSGAPQLNATGTVRIYDGKKRLGSYTLKAGHGGVLKVKLPKIKKKGTHKLKAVYAGTSNIAGKTTATVKLKVT